ncbi:MAG: TraR/DksA C4-type zinc finger protein [Pseudoxanthomonas sp.]|nr:TraR/DksA C4-type zinc finger protein [Pseudoxanthomonas sp.]
MINSNDREALVGRLQQGRVATLEAIASFEGSTRPVELDQATQGRLSRMDAMAQQQMALAGRAHLVAELTRIDAALDRVARGVFGRCGRCDLDIELDRLRADPSLPFCMECLEEIQEERRREEHLRRNR